MAEPAHQFRGTRTQYPDNPQRYLFVSDVMTQKLIPNAVEKFKYCNYRHVHLYLMKIIALQSFYCICAIYWIIDLNLTCKHTNQKLYGVAVKFKDKTNGYTCGLENKLFTKKDIYALPACAKLILPNVIINKHSNKYIKNVHAINLCEMEKFIKGKNKKWFMKQAWQNPQKIKVIINTKQCNSAERRYHIRKEDFVKILQNAAAKPMNLIYILVVDRNIQCGYAIDALWKVQIGNDLSVGISFRNFGNIIKASAIYVSVGIMSVYSILSGKSCGTFFDGWNESQFNNILVGDIRKNIYNENAALEEELRRTQDALKRTQHDLKKVQEEKASMLMQISAYSYNTHLLRRDNDILMKWRDDVQTFYPNEYEKLTIFSMNRESKTFQHRIDKAKVSAMQFINSVGIEHVKKLIDPQFLKDIQGDEKKNDENENVDLGMVYDQVKRLNNYNGSKCVGSGCSSWTYPMTNRPKPKTNK